VDEDKRDEPSAAETVGRTAGFLTRFVVRQALKSKTVREQVRDAQDEANRPSEPPAHEG